MPFFPESFDVTADVIGVLHLASIETDDETVRFVVGTDGRFVDINGFSWYGSSLFSVGELEVAINGIAPSGEASLSYFQDPAMPELIDDIKLQGADAVDGRPIRFYVQPLLAAEDLQAPKVAPILFASRTMRAVRYERTGGQQRRITLTFESIWEQRSRRRGLQYTTEDHARLTGSANPSLEFMPTDGQRDVKLWG
ncbi:hypothetical protein [Psychromarinibacter halotolerans]|uniref:Uncharacterized protein n=1 Tax=Psychromarinibacter halotolerans TaxID=1775175 RepID=A0ABV7GZT8_9RHOB|nr:hypothetical protein [Psychromarinibacter halotolerans]MAQ82255.1 hypothetical protein [Maritimibacter sp.]MDF0598994.1 hypothetical protein [Psychromarinibacter halotolerans]